jgi:hypothetical protein
MVESDDQREVIAVLRAELLRVNAQHAAALEALRVERDVEHADADRLRKLLEALPADMVDLAADRDSWLEQCEQARQWFQEEAARSKRLREALERLIRARLQLLRVWQCSGCRAVFAGRWRNVCPSCSREGFWTGSVEREAEARVKEEEFNRLFEAALTPPPGGTDTKETR